MLEPKKTLLFYSIQNKTDWNVLRKNYFQVADFLYLIEELEKDRFVKIQTLSFEVETEEFYMIEGNIGIILRTIHFGE